jgi:hypothetical protein
MTRQTLKAILISSLIFSSVAAHAVDADRIAATLESLRQSINAHDYSQLESTLAADFTYQGRDSDFSKTIMRQVVGSYPNDISVITILNIKETHDAWEVSVRLESADDADQRTVRLSKDYRILQADIADIALAGHPPPVEEPQANTEDLPAVTILPFTVAENIIVVKASINGVFGNYLVDTGAQAVVLNRPYFNEGEIEAVALDHAMPSGANGEVQDVQGAVDLDLTWGEIRIDDLRGLVADLSHLEISIGVPIVGIIGYNVLERFQIHFDYAAGELTLYSLDENSVPLLQSNIGSPLQLTRFDMLGHIPVFPVEIAGHEMQMGLDSGAGGAMMFTRWREKLEGQYEFIKRTEMNGADKNVQMGDVVRIENMQVQNIDYADMTFRFNDIAGHGGSVMPMDGLLGYEFLKARPTSINFRRRELAVWPALPN